MDNRQLLRTGLAGTVIAMVGCFTPALVVILSALGLSAIAGWLDYLLLPAFIIFVSLTVYALARRRPSASEESSLPGSRGRARS